MKYVKPSNSFPIFQWEAVYLRVKNSFNTLCFYRNLKINHPFFNLSPKTTDQLIFISKGQKRAFDIYWDARLFFDDLHLTKHVYPSFSTHLPNRFFF